MLSTLELHMYSDCLKNVEDLIFVDDKLPMKTAKITSHENSENYVPRNICTYTVVRMVRKLFLSIFMYALEFYH